MGDFYNEIECRRIKIKDPEYEWMDGEESEKFIQVLCETSLQICRFC